jgi:hypothetical protein
MTVTSGGRTGDSDTQKGVGKCGGKLEKLCSADKLKSTQPPFDYQKIKTEFGFRHQGKFSGSPGTISTLRVVYLPK